MTPDDRDGDALDGSFEDLFRQAYPGLVRVLAVAGGDAQVAEDCVQEAFSRAYTRWRRIRRYDDPSAWVRRVALNLLIDHQRKAARGRRAVARMDVETAAPPTERVSFDLAAALAGLPAQQRTAAALFYVDNLSVAEVADTMKLSPGAVKYHLHQARETLRPALAVHGEDLS